MNKFPRGKGVVIFHLSLLSSGGFDPHNHLCTYYVHCVDLLSWLYQFIGVVGVGAWEDKPEQNPFHTFAPLGKVIHWSQCSWPLSQRQSHAWGQLAHHTLYHNLAIWGTNCYRLCSLPSHLLPTEWQCGKYRFWNQQLY